MLNKTLNINKIQIYLYCQICSRITSYITDNPYLGIPLFSKCQFLYTSLINQNLLLQTMVCQNVRQTRRLRTPILRKPKAPTVSPKTQMPRMCTNHCSQLPAQQKIKQKRTGLLTTHFIIKFLHICNHKIFTIYLSCKM